MQVIPPPNAQPYSYLPPPSKAGTDEYASLRTRIRGPMLAGISVVVLLMAGFGGWATTAPLAGGAVASGVISPDGSRKTIQHLEGGIIAEIMVRDGDVVVAGTPLVTLEDTQARALHEMLLSRYRGLLAVQARLVAEQSGRLFIDFPRELTDVADKPEVSAILNAQQHLFETRRAALDVRQRVLVQRIHQIDQQRRGFEAQLVSSKHRREIALEELAAKEILFRKRLVPKPTVLRLRRELAEVGGDLGEYEAAVGRAGQQIGEAELELVALEAQWANEIAGELERVRGELAEVEERLGSSGDLLKRTVITAPVAGTVVNLRFKTRSGVIPPREPILDIVPADDDLLIDARIAPVDIDVVYPGLPAQVHLSAYAQRKMPRIDGTVRSISADSLRDPQTGTSYYLARVEVDRDSLAELDEGVELVPGMPAEVLIVTGERTLMGYLLQPFSDLFRRGLREA